MQNAATSLLSEIEHPAFWQILAHAREHFSEEPKVVHWSDKKK